MAQATEETLEKVFFHLECDAEGYPPVSSESLWATPIGKGLYRLENVPFFAREVSYQDIVAVETVDGRHWFKEVIEPSGSSTLRVVVFDISYRHRVIERLRQYGCSIEVSYTPKLFSVEVPKEAPYDEIIDYLNQGYESEELDYEEGCIRHG